MKLVIRLFVIFQILDLVISTTRLIIDVSNCDGPQKTVIDNARIKQNITSHCNCEIKSNFSGELILASYNACGPGFYVFDDNGQFNKTICYNNHHAHFRRNVTKGDKLNLVFINSSSFQSGNPGKIVRIYAKDNASSGLFSVTCGSASDSIGRTTRPTLVTGTFEFSNKGTLKLLPTRSAINNSTSVTEPNMYDPNTKVSKSEFPYRYAVAVESIVIVVALIIVLFLYIRRKTRAKNRNTEGTNEARTFDNATNGIECPENVDSNEQQQLQDNPLFQSYQINDDGGYLTCRFENIGHTEQLPDDTLYHFYEENGEMIDSKNENDRVGTSPSKERNTVYAHPNQRGKASSGNQDDSDRNENAYSYVQVKILKET